mgnify:CR=1 FL=1|jgi:hypothetical protein
MGGVFFLILFLPALLIGYGVLCAWVGDGDE